MKGMSKEDYFRALHGNEVDQTELEQVLASHFGAGQGISHREVTYSHQHGEPPGITLVYDSDDRLEAIYGGPALRSSDISELERKVREYLLADGRPTVGRSILLGSVPTNGFYRYKNIFQLRPVPSEAPRPPHMMGGHPLLLEFVFESSADGVIRIMRQGRFARTLELLCVALFPSIDGSLGNVMRMHWVISRSSDLANITSEYLQEAYMWPEPSVEPREALPACEGAPVARVATDEYYSRLGTSIGQSFDVPEEVDVLIAAFFALDNVEQERFLRGSFWFRHARRTYSHCQSASFIALVSAIEALAGDSAQGAPCKECKKPTGPGPTQLFGDFVERYAPGTAKKDRQELYRLRSKLSHGGHLLHHDSAIWMGGFSPTYLDQWTNMDLMQGIVRVALIHWLRDRQQAGPLSGFSALPTSTP